MKILDAFHEETLQLYNHGMNDREISEEMLVTVVTVYQWRKRNNLPSNYRKTTGKSPERIELLKQYKAEGKTNEEIAELLNVTDQTVYRWMREEGIHGRDKTSKASQNSSKRNEKESRNCRTIMG